MTTDLSRNDHREFGVMTRALASLCHRCGICASAARRPGSPFGKTMRWHRSWCPAWKAHSKVYGEKQLT